MSNLQLYRDRLRSVESCIELERTSTFLESGSLATCKIQATHWHKYQLKVSNCRRHTKLFEQFVQRFQEMSVHPQIS